MGRRTPGARHQGPVYDTWGTIVGPGTPVSVSMGLGVGCRGRGSGGPLRLCLRRPGGFHGLGSRASSCLRVVPVTVSQSRRSVVLRLWRPSKGPGRDREEEVPGRHPTSGVRGRSRVETPTPPAPATGRRSGTLSLPSTNPGASGRDPRGGGVRRVLHSRPRQGFGPRRPTGGGGPR